ncbi:YqaE/Pmp3 family membrane protein [Planctobacterium marinum]|uniref:Pmp3 family protein n=1 Tax=Planctobacterium marinum TaxID=1631968 RepID=A0AA48HT38_9ALTE|nr:Pmp3 family protein [Planctobacterium marinum]
MSNKDVSVLNLILAIILPPVGAFLQVGLTLHFFLNIVLTLMGGIPGMIHAVWLVVSKRTA